MSFRDFFGIRHGGYQPKADARPEEPLSGPLGPPPRSGSGVQPPESVPRAESSIRFGNVGDLTFGIREASIAVVGSDGRLYSSPADRLEAIKRQAREALVEKAALAILQGAWAGNEPAYPQQIWFEAERFVDAREAGAAAYRDSLKEQAASKGEEAGQ